jgi:hypothetical protein
MGGKTSKSTQTVSIPPEVLARYNAVNARAEDVASRPFQPYSYNPADFVAQLTPTQLAGIQNVNYAAGQAQPYFDEATNQLMGGQMAAVPYYGQAGQDVAAGQGYGMAGTQAAQNLMYGGINAAYPLNYQALGTYQQGYGQGQQLLGQGIGQYYGAQAAAQPFQQTAAGNIVGAQDIGAQLAQQAYAQQAAAGAAAQPYTQAAGYNIAAAQDVGSRLAQEAYAQQARAGAVADPFQYAAAGAYQQGYGQGQQLLGQGVNQFYNALGAAQPLQYEAAGGIRDALGIGRQLGSESYATTQRAGETTMPINYQSLAGLQQALAAAQPYTQEATQRYGAGLEKADPLQQYALQTLGRAGMTGESISSEALASLAGAGYAAQPLQQLAQGIYGEAYQGAQPYNQAALQQYYGGLGAAGPLSQQALQNVAAAQAGAQPYQQFATELGLAAARPVSPGQLTGFEIGRYMSPYMSTVVGQTQALLNQQAQQAQAEQTGNAIRAGAFGGDRARIAAANLAQQQQLAQGKVLGDLLQSGYGQALQTAQQQQQVNLAAEQANRAAQQAAAGQLLGVGQTGFGQGITAAQQQAALAQQLFGQQVAAGQGIAGLGQQTFAQGLSAGQAQQALAQQLFGQGATTAQQQAAIAQSLFGQGATSAAQQAALAQQMFGQQATTAQGLAALGQQLYSQGTGTAQAQAAIGQQMFAQQMAKAQQEAALSQMLYGQGMGASQAQAALAQQQFAQQQGIGQNLLAAGQQGFQQGLGLGQAQQGLGQQLFGQNIQQAQLQSALGQQLFGQGTTAAQQQAALGQQVFGQGMSQAQQQAALSQLLFGQGTTAAQQQAALGQQVFGQGLNVGQALTGAGQQAFQQAQGLGGAQQAIAQQLFGQGLSASQQQAALGQQGFAQQLAAAQARQQLGQGLYGMGAGTAQQLAALGTGAQGAALQGAQAQLAAGQAQQQTAQAGLQALYNQFLQQQAYPFQVAQFLGNIAMGTGALSGSTTTTSQPGSIFSDIRTKENVREVGKTLDGQPIYSYNYKGDPKTQMGLIAQEVEERHPEAVGLAGGLKTVNYKKATRDAERRGEILDAEFSPISEGGSVTRERAGLGFADGGMPEANDAANRAEEEMKQRQQEQAAQNEQRAAQAAVQTAKQQAPAPKQAPAPQVDLKPNLSVKPEVGGTAPAKLDIPTTPPSIPQLAVAGPAPAADQGSKDAQAIAALMMAFSDRRMKEDVKHIGFTHDGQKIYSYRIKGEPHTQIGLMADEVERHKPEAVGSMNGLKMVDYDRATEDAVRKSRGGYADGGSPGLASPADMAALLQAQAQMFGPFGDYARTLTGNPGAPGYVPGANLPVSGLVTAGDLPTARSTADDIQAALNIGQGIENLRRKPAPVPTTKTTTPAGSTTETETPGALKTESADEIMSELGRYRGGLAYADGGQVIPYATPTALNIPVEMKTPELMKAGSLPKQRSTMEDIADALGIASDAKNLMPKAYGGSIGRNGYQTGGDPTFAERFIPGIQTQEGVDENRRAMMDFIEKRILKNPYLNTTEAARLRDERLRMQPTSATSAAPATTAAPPAAAPAATRPQVSRPAVVPAATNRPEPGLVPAVQSPAVGAGPTVVPPAPAAAPTGGLAPPAAVAPTAVPAATPPAAPAMTPATVPAAAAAPSAPTGFMDWLRKEENYIPLLRGAAAAAAAPTQYTLPALLVGAGAYGKAKGDIMQQLAEIESEKARAQETRASARATTAGTAKDLAGLPYVKDAEGRAFVLLADGSRMLAGTYLSLPVANRPPVLGQQELTQMTQGITAGAPVLSTAPISAVAPATGAPAAEAGAQPQSLAQQAESQIRVRPITGRVRHVGPAGEEALLTDYSNLVSQPPANVNAQLERSLENRQIINAAADAAYNQGGVLSQLSSSILKLPSEGFIASGPMSDIKANIARYYNDIMRTVLPSVGVQNVNEYLISPDEIGTKAGADKLTGFLSFAQSKGAGQLSLGGLQSAAEIIPSSRLSREEAVNVLSGMYIDKQRSLDQQNYLNDYVNRLNELYPGQGHLFLTENAMRAFRNESQYSEQNYMRDKKAIMKVMSTKFPSGESLFDRFMSGKITASEMDSVAGRLMGGGRDSAVPISRYFQNR